jgi:hypothetical protein
MFPIPDAKRQRLNPKGVRPLAAGTTAPAAEAAAAPSPAPAAAAAAPALSPKGTAHSTTKKDGVDEAGRHRFGASWKTFSWRPAAPRVALKFWVVMSVLICGTARSVIAFRKPGRARKAADGLLSYAIAYFIIEPMLKRCGIFDASDDTALNLYIFVHFYIAHHLTNAERRRFFGSGSCFFGAVYINAITDRLETGMCMADSWAKSIGLIRGRYVAMATTLSALRKPSPHARTVVVEITGGVLEMQAGDADVTETLTFEVAANEVYVPHESEVTILFCSNVYEKAFEEACPFAQKELKTDLKITTCPNTRSEHIQSDTFFGLRIEIKTIASSASTRTQKVLRKELRKEAKKLCKERMKRREAMKSLIFHSVMGSS